MAVMRGLSRNRIHWNGCFVVVDLLFLWPFSCVCGQVSRLLEELLKDKDKPDNLTKCEGRALPLRGAQLDHLRKQNLRRVQANSKAKDQEKSQEKGDEKEASFSGKKPPQRQLYEILIAPVEDILMKVRMTCNPLKLC